MGRILGFLAVLLLLSPGVSAAQSALARPAVTEVFVDLNVIDAGSYFTKSRKFTGLFIKFGEQGRFDATYPKPSRALIVPVDIAAGVYQRQGLAVGIGVTRTSLRDRVSVAARVPHPALLDTPGTATGETGELSRVETAINGLLIVVPMRSSRFEWRVSAGPSFFLYSADMVQSVVYSQSVPAGSSQNVVSIDGATTAAVHAKTMGFHMGSDVALSLGRRLAITGGVRFSSGVVTVGHEPLSGIEQNIRVGRKAVLVGIRVHVGHVR